MAIIHDFPSIARIMNRQVQKAEFETKQPAKLSPAACETIVALAASAGIPRFELPDLRGRVFTGVRTGGASVPMDQMGPSHAGRLTGGACESLTLTTAQLPPYTPSGAYVAPEEDPA
jgi:hypothetical protein